MNELMRQATRMQRKMEEIREELKDVEMSASTAGGKVRVTVSCEGKLRRIDIDDKFVKEEGVEMALDLIVAAANKALEDADNHVEAELSKVSGGLKLPPGLVG